VPLADHKETMEAYKAWEAQQGKVSWKNIRARDARPSSLGPMALFKYLAAYCVPSVTLSLVPCRLCPLM